jgi:peptide chain release factor subunit 1
MDQTNRKEREVMINFEPFWPAIPTLVSYCDNCFHMENSNNILTDKGEDPYGFIVIDGNRSLFGVVQGFAREVLHKFTVDISKKHSILNLVKKDAPY